MRAHRTWSDEEIGGYRIMYLVGSYGKLVKEYTVSGDFRAPTVDSAVGFSLRQLATMTCWLGATVNKEALGTAAAWPRAGGIVGGAMLD